MTSSVECNAYLEILLKELLVRLLHDLRLGSKLGVVRQSVHLVDENLEPAQQASINLPSSKTEWITTSTYLILGLTAFARDTVCVNLAMASFQSSCASMTKMMAPHRSKTFEVDGKIKMGTKYVMNEFSDGTDLAF